MHRHDALWKGLLQAFFPQFIQFVVPELADRLLVEKGRFIDQESFVDPPEGEKALLDLVAEVPAIDGPDELILIHIEVERRFRQAMDLRMWRYFAHLSLKYGRPIVPIVLFLKGGEGGITRRPVEFKAGDVLVNRFIYWSIGLSKAKAHELLKNGPLGIALATCARGDRLQPHEQKLLCMEALLGVDVNDAEAQLLITAIETYLKLNEEQNLKYHQSVERSPRKSEVMAMELTWAGKLHEKGVAEGVEVGRREGVEAGRKMLSLILQQRFGELPKSLSLGIGSIEDPSRFEPMTRGILRATSLDEVEKLFKS